MFLSQPAQITGTFTPDLTLFCFITTYFHWHAWFLPVFSLPLQGWWVQSLHCYLMPLFSTLSQFSPVNRVPSRKISPILFWKKPFQRSCLQETGVWEPVFIFNSPNSLLLATEACFWGIKANLPWGFKASLDGVVLGILALHKKLLQDRFIIIYYLCPGRAQNKLGF